MVSKEIQTACDDFNILDNGYKMLMYIWGFLSLEEKCRGVERW